MTKRITFADLFSGCGGFSYGFANHRSFRGLLAVDNWSAAQKVYVANIGNIPFQLADLHDPLALASVSSALQGRTDVLLGGPPCQAFSTLGKRAKDDRRERLLDSFLQIAASVQPKIVVLENVPGIGSKRNAEGVTFSDYVQDALRAKRNGAGYTSTIVLLKGTDYGLAQTRLRWILIAVRNDLGRPIDLLTSIVHEIDRRRDPAKVKTVRDVIADLPTVHPGGGAEVAKARKGPKGVPVYNHRAMSHSDRLQEILSHVPAGGGLLDVPRRLLSPHLKRMVDGYYGSGGHVKNIYGRLRWSDTCGTIVAGIDKITCGRFVHPNENRLLTPRECARLQSFPDPFRFEGSLVTQYYLIGNAVPPRFSEVLASSIASALRASERKNRILEDDQIREVA